MVKFRFHFGDSKSNVQTEPLFTLTHQPAVPRSLPLHSADHEIRLDMNTQHDPALIDTFLHLHMAEGTQRKRRFPEDLTKNVTRELGVSRLNRS